MFTQSPKTLHLNRQFLISPLAVLKRIILQSGSWYVHILCRLLSYKSTISGSNTSTLNSLHCWTSVGQIQIIKIDAAEIFFFIPCIPLPWQTLAHNPQCDSTADSSVRDWVCYTSSSYCDLKPLACSRDVEQVTEVCKISSFIFKPPVFSF